MVAALLSLFISLIFQGLSQMRTNPPAVYSQMDMGAGNQAYFSFNMAALASMSNQQLEVSNELHITPPTLHGMAPHIPQTPLLIVTVRNTPCLVQQLFIHGNPSDRRLQWSLCVVKYTK